MCRRSKPWQTRHWPKRRFGFLLSNGSPKMDKYFHPMRDVPTNENL